MELVPFFSEWAGSEASLDLHAYYRRPPTAAVPGLTLTTALPVRAHHHYIARGLIYVSLASAADVNAASGFLRSHGIDPRSFKDSYRTDLGGVFDLAQYAREASQQAAAELIELRKMVKKFGAEAVIEIKRVEDPTFELPAEVLEPEPAAAVVAPKRPGLKPDQP